MKNGSAGLRVSFSRSVSTLNFPSHFCNLLIIDLLILRIAFGFLIASHWPERCWICLCAGMQFAISLQDFSGKSL